MDDMTNDQIKAWQHEARKILQANNCGQPVGFRILREDASGKEPCADGCLAPGSSPHSHPKVVGYTLVGTSGYVDTDAALVLLCVGRLNSLTD